MFTITYNNFPFPPQLPNNFSIPTIPSVTTTTQEELKQYQTDKKHIVVIGQGGSVNSIRALGLIFDKHIHIIDTVDPYKLRTIKEKVQHDCLVIPISKSGNTLSTLQATAYFNDLPMLIIAEDGALKTIAQHTNTPFVQHPPIGGRFIGATIAGLLPAHLAGINTKPLLDGANTCFAQTYSTAHNDALLLALHMYTAETHGLYDIYMPIYDSRLAATKELIMQLCHETYGKHHKGQTVLALEGPECQHHTNQRYFGGPNNMLGIFISVQNSNEHSHIHIPHNWHNIQVSDKPLTHIDGMAHQQTLQTELSGVLAHAHTKNMPHIHIQIPQVNEQTVGYFFAFWQLTAIYSALLRGCDPFDQPEVEYAKNTTKKLLFQ